MIRFLRGNLTEARPTCVVVEVGGVGYEIAVPLSSHNKLPPKGGEVFFHIHHYFGTRFDPTQRLFGFLTATEREMYELLLDVVGPKVALNIVGGISPDLFRSALAAGDAKALAAVPGLGKKIAERIVVELRDKAAPSLAATTAGGALPADQQLVADAVAALVSLGYKPLESHERVRKVSAKLGKKADLESLIREALK